jgi:hypothetical protein
VGHGLHNADGHGIGHHVSLERQELVCADSWSLPHQHYYRAVAIASHDYILCQDVLDMMPMRGSAAAALGGIGAFLRAHFPEVWTRQHKLNSKVNEKPESR